MKWMCVAVVAFAAACGGGKSVSVTCNVATTDSNQCSEVTSSSKSESVLAAGCEAVNGTVTFDPCSPGQYLGECDSTSDGASSKAFVYPSSTITSTAGAKTACSNIGGSFKAATSFAVCDINTASNNTCSQVSGTSATLDGAPQACANAGGTYSIGTCMRTGYLGTCALSSTGAVATDFLYTSSTITSVSDAQAACAQANGTFTAAM